MDCDQRADMPPPLQPPPDSGHREAETEQYLPSDIDKCRKLVSSKIWISIAELYTEDDFRQLVVAIEATPISFGSLGELEDHGERSLV